MKIVAKTYNTITVNNLVIRLRAGEVSNLPVTSLDELILLFKIFHNNSVKVLLTRQEFLNYKNFIEKYGVLYEIENKEEVVVISDAQEYLVEYIPQKGRKSREESVFATSEDSARDLIERKYSPKSIINIRVKNDNKEKTFEEDCSE